MTDEADEKWDTLVGQLVTLTRDKKLPWSSFKAGTRSGGPEEDVKGLVYEGNYLGRTIFVFEYEYRHWLDEDRAIIDTDVAVELQAKNTASTWRLPETGKRFTLIDEIRKLTVEADDWADEVLKQMPPPDPSVPSFRRPPKKA